jgi:hypothetical protein
MPYGLLWVLWIIAFFAIEIPAWRDNHEGGTLSEYIWAIFSVRTKGPGWLWRRLTLLTALGALFYHFTSANGWFVI